MSSDLLGGHALVGAFDLLADLGLELLLVLESRGEDGSGKEEVDRDAVELQLVTK